MSKFKLLNCKKSIVDEKMGRLNCLAFAFAFANTFNNDKLLLAEIYSQCVMTGITGCVENGIKSEVIIPGIPSR
jgi:hypothetical protein